jgi:hypothetical protein
MSIFLSALDFARFAHHRSAAVASKAAGPVALKVLDSAAVRTALKEVAPALAKVPASELLSRWREEVASANSQLSHNLT